MVKQTLLEVCCPSEKSILLAAAAKVERIELCEDLSCGGVTPSDTLLELALQQSFRTHVLVRPRGGDFVYNEAEIVAHCTSIRKVLEMGAQGVVVGAAHANQELDLIAMKRFKEAAGDRTIYCHRVFDAVPDKAKSLQELIHLGYDGVLTSGGEGKAIEYTDSLKRLVELAPEGFCILIGGGVRAENFLELQRLTNGKAFHSAVGDENDTFAYQNALEALKQNIL